MEFWRYGDMEILEVRVRDGSGGSDGRDGDQGWQLLGGGGRCIYGDMEIRRYEDMEI